MPTLGEQYGKSWKPQTRFSFQRLASHFCAAVLWLACCLTAPSSATAQQAEEDARTSSFRVSQPSSIAGQRPKEQRKALPIDGGPQLRDGLNQGSREDSEDGPKYDLAKVKQPPSLRALPPVEEVEEVEEVDVKEAKPVLFDVAQPVSVAAPQLVKGPAKPPVEHPAIEEPMVEEPTVEEPRTFLLDVGRNMYFWLQHIEGRQIGDVSPSTNIGGAQYVRMHNGVLMAVGQGVITNNGDGGGNIGLQRRWLWNNHVVGAGLWFDVTQTRLHNPYQQLALSLELLGDVWSVRGNAYLPVGKRTRRIAGMSGFAAEGGLVFQGSNLISKNTVLFRVDETAMLGGDIEVARSILGGDAQVFAGFYNFQGEIGRQTNGLKGGLRGYLLPRLAATATIAEDPIFGTNVFGGFTWFFGGAGGNAPRSIRDKLTIPVERNNQVVVNHVIQDSNLGTVVLTDNDKPITFMHVTDSGLPGDGTVEKPYNSLSAADAAGSKGLRDIVYVHSGTSFSNQRYSLAKDQRFLGEGDNNQHLVSTDQLGTVVLPAVNGTAGSRPLITGAAAPSTIELASGAEVSNFRINNASTAIRAFTGNGNASVNRTIITGGTTGVDLVSKVGTLAFSDVQISNQTGRSVRITAGSPDVTFDADSSINQSAGGSVIQVVNTLGGTLAFDGTIDANSGDGLQFDNVMGTYDFDGKVDLDGGNAGIDIRGGSAGTFTFADTDITDPIGTALNIDGQGAGSRVDVNFNGGSITQSNNSAAVSIDDHRAGTVRFASGTTISSTAGTGLQFSNADGDYEFNGTATMNGGNAGIDILNDSDGTFTFDHNTLIVANAGKTDAAFNLDGGMAKVTYRGNIDVLVGANVAAVNVQGGHRSGMGDVTFELGAITASDGTGLQFNNADGTYNFSGPVTLKLGDAGIDIVNDSDGLFNFAKTTISSPTGTAVNINGGSSTVRFELDSSILQSQNATAINVQGGHDGSLTFAVGSSVIATNGNGLQFSNADGNYNFRGSVVLNGGNAGIDIINDSDGIFEFLGDTLVSNSTGRAVDIDGGVTGQAAAVRFLGVDINQSIGDGVFANNSGDLIIDFSEIDNTSGHGVNVTSTSTANLTMNGTEINIGASGTRGISFQGSGGGLSLKNLDIDMNSGGGTTGIRIQNTSGALPMFLDGTNNIVIDAANPTSSFDAGGGFIGTIEVNGGTDDLP